VFSIPDDSQAFMNGSPVAPEYKLRASDEVECPKRGAASRRQQRGHEAD
jgi:hypothetical protein